MRLKGLGGKKLSILWNTAGIDSVDNLLEACKSDKISQIPGFGAKTQENIIKVIEAYRSNEDRFHYASIADSAEVLVQRLQQTFKTKLISLCREVRRQSTTVVCIEIVAAISAINLKENTLRKYLIIQSSNKEQTRGHTPDEIPVVIYHTTKNRFYYELFNRTGNERHVTKVLTRIKIMTPTHQNKLFIKRQDCLIFFRKCEKMLQNGISEIKLIVSSLQKILKEWFIITLHGVMVLMPLIIL